MDSTGAPTVDVTTQPPSAIAEEDGKPLSGDEATATESPVHDGIHGQGEDVTEFPSGMNKTVEGTTVSNSVTSDSDLLGSTIKPKLGEGDKTGDVISDGSVTEDGTAAEESSSQDAPVDVTSQPTLPADIIGVAHDEVNGTVSNVGSEDKATTVLPAVEDSSALPESDLTSSSIVPEKELLTVRPAAGSAEDIGAVTTSTPITSLDMMSDKLFDSSKDSESDSMESSSRVPGEGSCFVEGLTYQNGSSIPPTTPCHLVCACQNSIVHCLLVHCPPPTQHH
jgi:hypothetical protein